MSHTVVATDKAPTAIGPYSQAIRAGNTVYMSGQIAMDPATGDIVPGGIEAQAQQAFKNLQAVAREAGGDLADCVKLTLYLTDLSQFGVVNEVMKQFFETPYPARATVGISSLPKGAEFEVDGVMVTP